MTRYIAFLRAINVGGRIVKMDRLRELFAELKLANVETFIASGNVIFESPAKDAQALERKIEKHLRESLGYEVATFLRSVSELAEVAEYRPFAASELEEHTLYIGFLPASPAAAAQQAVTALRTEVDEFHFHARELYWLCRKKLSESTISGAQLERKLGMPATLRNATTVRKLAAKYRP